jgi:hypothetical protein
MEKDQEKFDNLDKKVLQKLKSRDKKIGKPKMIVTGKGIFKLQEIIKKKK